MLTLLDQTFPTGSFIWPPNTLIQTMEHATSVAKGHIYATHATEPKTKQNLHKFSGNPENK